MEGGRHRKHHGWRPGGWGVEIKLETCRLGIGDNTGDLAARECRQHWRLRGWGLEMTPET